MQLPFFYERILPDSTDNFELSAKTSRHLVQVLRMKTGESLILTNGKGVELTVTIASPDKKRTVVSFKSKRNLLSPPNLNGIAVSLLKNESRFEWFLEKATELGIRYIYPLITSRTEKKSFRHERMLNIMISAMIQSRQYFLPELSEPVSLKQIFGMDNFQQKLIAYCSDEGEKPLMQNIMEDDIQRIILIGPEGDFTPDEIKDCTQQGFLPVSLGENRLRTETAGIVAAVYLSK